MSRPPLLCQEGSGAPANHSHLLQMRGAWIFAPDTERFLNGTIREAEEYRLRLRLMCHGIPGWGNKDIVIFPVECSVADLRTAAAFDNAIHGRVGCAMRRTQKTGGQKLNESADRRHRISACGRIDVLHLDPVTGMQGPVSVELLQRFPSARVGVIEHR